MFEIIGILVVAYLGIGVYFFLIGTMIERMKRKRERYPAKSQDYGLWPVELILVMFLWPFIGTG